MVTTIGASVNPSWFDAAFFLAATRPSAAGAVNRQLDGEFCARAGLPSAAPPKPAATPAATARLRLPLAFSASPRPSTLRSLAPARPSILSPARAARPPLSLVHNSVD